MKLTVMNTAKTILVWGLVSTAQGQTFLQGIDLNAKTEQLRIIAITILSESRGEASGGMMRVAQTILNRARRSGKTAAFECLRPVQFSFWNHAPSRAQCLKLLSCPQADYAMILASDVLEGRDIIAGFEATNFHSGSPPKWAYSPRMRFIEKFKHHTFYKEI